MRNVILIGMPACGKSTLGVLLAKVLMMDFADTDLLIQKHYQKPLQQLVDELGAEAFSQMEEDFVASLHLQNAVIATGGSVALEEKAMQHLKKDGVIVFVKLSYESIERRLHNIATRGIAMKKGQTLRQLYELRQPFYHQWADIIVEADGQDIEETMTTLVQRLK